MQFRRNGLRDERRRRALMDDRNSDSSNQSASNESASNMRRSARSYSKTAVDERRIRIVDAVPVYVVHVALFYAAILLTITGLLALHHYASSVVRWADLSRVDSLGTYLSAGALFVGAMIAFLTYRIRRHRLDDYRGRYRCWLWFAALLLFASVDFMLDFRSDVARGLEAVTRVRLLGKTEGWWIVVWSVAYGSMALRAILEVRQSIGTLIVGLLGATLIFLGMAVQLDLLLVPGNMPVELACHAAQLTGVGLLMASLVQYARFVWMDAQGLISRGSIEVADEEEESETKAKKPARRARAATKKPAAKVAEPADDDEEEAEAKPRRGWFSWGRKQEETDEAEEPAKPVATKSRSASKPVEEEETETKPKRGWFSFGKKAAAEEEDDEAPAPVKAKPAAKKQQEAESEEATEPKRGWFSFGKKAATDDEEAEKSAPLKAKLAAKKQKEAESEEAAQPKRGWFSFGKKQADAEEAEEAPAAKKPKVATPPPAEEEAEAKPKRGWFSWGSKDAEASDEEDAADSDEPRTTMTPRVKTRPKPPAAAPAPAPQQPPTITGKYNQEDDDESNSAEDEEILRLEAKPDHMLSKAERRRLKKLKRRTAA
ncbi:hypothetical protein [Bremerella cremea]|uniref:hypothetical protein n=1 Tax=Bremerella cremea TaxID=1031537 RepID=UPI0031F0C9B7